MPLFSSPEPIVNSGNYYLPGGDLYIWIQDTMFQIHQYFFNQNSTLLWMQLECYENNVFDLTQTGTTCSDAIMFFNNQYTSPHTFPQFLLVIYNPKYNIYDGYTQQDWYNILWIAMAWDFKVITQLAILHIEDIQDEETNKDQTIHIPSPTDTEIVESSEDYNDMYVNKNWVTSEPLSISLPFFLREDPTDRAMQLHFEDDHGIWSLGLQP